MSPFLDACARRPVPRTPVWFLRQAGRYLPEYRQLRKRYDILELCRTAELAAEVTLMPVRRFDVDAAIVFSDIMVPVAAMGVDLRIDPGLGPVIRDPIRTAGDVERLRPIEAGERLNFLVEAIRMVVGATDLPVIGFAGGPFTLASYLIEGGPTRSFARTKALMLSAPETWHALMNKLAETAAQVLHLQVDAGASAVQLFDSWVGALSPAQYEEFVLPHTRKILASLEAPRIHFGVGTGEFLPLLRDAGAEVVGVDHRVPLDVAWDRLGPDVAVQGNLDPAVLLAPWEVVRRETVAVMRQAGGRPGHIFNVGHGLLPGTDPDVVGRVVDLVHELSGGESGGVVQGSVVGKASS